MPRTILDDAISRDMNAHALLQVGFTPAGTCSIEPRLKGGVRFALTVLRKVRVIYAFVVDNEAKYIGVCAQRPHASSSSVPSVTGIVARRIAAR